MTSNGNGDGNGYDRKQIPFGDDKNVTGSQGDLEKQAKATATTEADSSLRSE